MTPPLPLANRLLNSLQDVIGSERVGLHEPQFQGQEKAYVIDCIESTFVSSVGAYVTRFEQDLADFTGARRAVAVSNGTAAIQVALRVVGVQEGDEVLCPALTFVATANAISYLGAMPHFFDSDPETLGVDVDALRSWLLHKAERTQGGIRNKDTGRRISAIVPMHTFGIPCDMDALQALCHDCGLIMVEDNAEALGSKYFGKATGTFGAMGCLSFNGNKIITTGGGGAILTDDEKLADFAKHVTTTAKVPHSWEYVHDCVGYNYRLPNLNAALGCAQLEAMPSFLESKRRLHTKYAEALADMPSVRLVTERDNCTYNYWLQTLVLDPSVEDERDSILATTNEAGMMTRPIWRLLHRLPMYENCARAPLDNAMSLERRVVNIPSSAGLA